VGDFDEQLGDAAHESCIRLGSPSVFRQDAEQGIRLRFALESQRCRSVVKGRHPGCVLLVVAEPHERRNVSATVRRTDRTRHEHHPIDQFGSGSGRHGLVERVKCRLVEPLALDEGARRTGDEGRSDMT
jgi:hypothetical protein